METVTGDDRCANSCAWSVELLVGKWLFYVHAEKKMSEVGCWLLKVKQNEFKGF